MKEDNAINFENLLKKTRILIEVKEQIVSLANTNHTGEKISGLADKFVLKNEVSSLSDTKFFYFKSVFEFQVWLFELSYCSFLTKVIDEIIDDLINIIQNLTLSVKILLENPKTGAKVLSANAAISVFKKTTFEVLIVKI